MKFTVKKTDWVSFIRDNRLVYAEVMYVTGEHTITPAVITTAGEVALDRILEVRPYQ